MRKLIQRLEEEAVPDSLERQMDRKVPDWNEVPRIDWAEVDEKGLALLRKLDRTMLGMDEVWPRGRALRPTDSFRADFDTKKHVMFIVQSDGPDCYFINTSGYSYARYIVNLGSTFPWERD